MKALKRRLILSTALISVLTAAPSHLSAAPKTAYSNHEEVNEGDTPLTIAGKGVNFLVSDIEDGVGPGEARHMSYAEEAKLIERNLQDCKEVVKSSASLANLNSFKQFAEQHTAQFRTSLNRRPLSDTGDQAKPLIEKISLQMFKSSKSYLQHSKNRKSFEHDPELGGLFTFTLNTNQEISVFVEDLSICVPFFKGFKSDFGVDHLTPYAHNLTAKQKNAALFLNRVLAEYPRFPLKRALRVAKEYLGETDGSLWNILSGTSSIRLPVEQDLTKYTFPNMSREDKAFCLQMLINTTDWNQIYALGRAVNLDDRFIPLVNSKRSLVKDTAHVGMHRLLQYTYNNALEIKRRIAKDTWQDVYDYSEGLGISVDRVIAYHNASLADYKAYMLETNPLLDMYEQSAHMRSLIKTKYWKDVYAYTNKIPLSADHVVFLNKHKNDLSFHTYINSINPFQAGTLNK